MANKEISRFCSDGKTVMNGYIRPIDKKSYKTLTEIIKKSNLFENEEIFAYTVFGDILAVDSEGYVMLFKLLEGMKTVICAEGELFFTLVNDAEYRKDYFRINEYNYALKNIGELKKDECYTYVPLPALGGGMSNDEISKGKAIEYMQLLVTSALN